MQKPDKIFLDSPNLLYALATVPVKIGTVREWTFEVGGENKSYSQIADIPDSYVLADDIETPHGNKIPLWMMGFLY